MSDKRLWSINQLSAEFGHGWNQVKRRLGDVPPDGFINKKPAWLIRNAAPMLVTAPASDNTGGAEDMKPKDRLDYVKSERELMKLRSETGGLIPAGEHREGLASLAKLFVNGVDLLVDQIERECGLTPDQAALVQKQCDSIRDQVYEANAKLCS